MTLLETLRVLLLSSFQPLTPLEFHFYSAEEGGLLGSQAVASSYELSSIKVQAMLQQDMTAFVKPGTEERAGLVSDFTSPDLTKFISMLVSEYTYLKPTSTKLGYAASDHASWTKIGVPAAFAVEAPYEDCNLQKIHTAGDTFDIPEYSFKHLLQFVRLSSAFAVELTGWT